MAKRVNPNKEIKDKITEYSKARNRIWQLVNQDSVDNSIWAIRPVGIKDFCQFWIRQPLFKGDQEQLARDCFTITTESLPKEFQEILLLVGKGGGKGHVSAILITYYAYLLLCMRDPRKYLGIGRTAPIHLLNVSYNSRQAKDVFFNGYLVPMVRATINPETRMNFFEQMGVDLREDHGDIQTNKIFFERPSSGNSEGGISAESIASDSHSGEGYSPIIVFVDEFSAMKPDHKAVSLIDKLTTSAESRFGDFRKVIIASYKHGKNCKMSVRFNKSSQNKTPGVYLMRSSTWAFNDMKSREMFNRAYEIDDVRARMYYECLDSEGVDELMFFKRVEKLDRSFPNIEDLNPIIGNVQSISSNLLKDIRFKEFFRASGNTKYCIHIDLAKGTQADQCGFTMSHKVGTHSLKAEDIDRYINGEINDEGFKVKTDLILQIRKSEIVKEIVLDDIRQFVYRLKDMGFKLKVTLDGFQSLDFIQQLNQNNIEAEMYSVDRTKKPYDSLKTLIYRDGLESYYHPVLWRELTELEESEDGKKVDHPFQSSTRYLEDGISAGSKDLADALCGSCVQSLLCPADSVPIKPMMSESGSRHDERTNDDINFEQQVMGKKYVQVDSKVQKHRRPENWNMPFLK